MSVKIGSRDRRAWDPGYYLHQPSALLSVLALPCKKHGARPGEPCWTIEAHRAVCGRRIRARVS